MRITRFRSRMVVVALGTATASLVASTAAVRTPESPKPVVRTESTRLRETPVDLFFTDRWSQAGITAAAPADDLAVLRRASLALYGTIPSLEEIRSFEADGRRDRLRRRLRTMLDDPRFSDYFAERLARAWVGVEGEPFLVYRRDRFTRWLAEQLRDNRPYDDLARAVLSTDGLWTSEPAVNFVTSSIANENVDENELAARTVRGFLGQRIDCAQCHDHLFAEWKQAQFEGLAAFFGQSAVSPLGVVDQPRLFDKALELTIEVPETKERRVVAPSVPFLNDRLPSAGSRRDRLAAWVTDPDNERFTRATVNRVWGLLFGRPFSDPVDDLPDPGDEQTAILDRLGLAFRDSNYDLRWLIEEIIVSRPFRIASSLPGIDDAAFETAEAIWAVYPLTRLRPEQVVGSMIQASRLQTIDQNSHLVARTLRFFREQDFVRGYGDAGDAELDARSGTVAQALLRMNGDLARELFKASPVTSVGRMTLLESNDERLVELCFLVTLTRRPNSEESAHFEALVHGTAGDARAAAVEDVVWSLVNSAEFSWNH